MIPSTSAAIVAAAPRRTLTGRFWHQGPTRYPLVACPDVAVTADDYQVCQEIAALARTAGFDGVLAPSVALKGQLTLVVFRHAMVKVQPIGPEKIRQAPPRMVDLLEAIRLHPDVPTSVRRLLWLIRSAGRQAMARARLRR